MIGTGLFGPALGPLFVGLVSDAVSVKQAANGLPLALLIVPVVNALTGLAYLAAQRITVVLREH